MPHAHILLWLEEACKCKTAAKIDDIISAELPSPTDDIEGYKVVTEYMLHGPCGTKGKYAPCTTEGKCTKRYPKAFYAETILDDDGRDEIKFPPATAKPNHIARFKKLASLAAKGSLRQEVLSAMLLNIVRGPQNFEELLTVNNRLCETFKAACFAYGQLNDDKEWTRAILEASGWALPHKSVTCLLQSYCFVTSADHSRFGKKRREALDFDMNKSKIEHQQLHPLLNPEHRLNYEQVNDSVHNQRGAFYFVYGPGGTGKTFLYRTIISRLRSERKIVLAVTSSGIASLLLPGGRTAHSRFVIPLELLENSTCGIKQNTHLAELMQEVQLIIWDEAPMTQKYAFETLDKTLRDILGFHKEEKRDKIFGGMTVLLGGNFRQILPVIPKVKRPDVIQACINRS
ncbi:ATP-dependent DNA helicase PIF1-like protein [Tanacetum coccineum]